MESQNGVETMFSVKGMNCGSCVRKIEKRVKKVWPELVYSCDVALATNTAKIVHDASLSVEVIGAELTQIGFPATEMKPENNAEQLHKAMSREDEATSYYNNARTSLLFALPLMINMLVLMHLESLQPFLMHRIIGDANINDLLQMALGIPTVYCGRDFFVHGWADIRSGGGTMNVLISLGVTTAFLSTILRVFGVPTQGQADAGAILISFMLIGKYIETKARTTSASDMLGLLEMQPKVAHIVTADGVETKPVENLKKGMVFLVKHGERIPADGEVVSGECATDESIITGEATPCAKEVGSPVAAGSLCVEGTVRARATKVGGDATLAQIIRLVNDAQTNRAPVQAFADRIAGVFVPVVVSIAVGSFAVWLTLGLTDSYPASWRSGITPAAFATNFLLTSLVVACPCAMGLATPTAVMVASGVAARYGVFVKGAGVFELSAKARNVLFDKTGTLTTGKMTVKASKVYRSDVSGSVDTDTAKAIVHVVEGASAHPIAAAVAECCRRSSVPTDEIEVLSHSSRPGRGIVATLGLRGGRRVTAVVGSVAFASEQIGRPLADETVLSWQTQGHTVVAAVLDGELRSLFALGDSLKPEAAAVVKHLQSCGCVVRMVTGDSRRAAVTIAQNAGIPENCVLADTLPEEKASIVATVSSSGGTIFVGDGINDAPALARASVGVALGTGTGVAVDAADVVLTGGDLRGVATLVSLSRATLRRIKMNFVWAFGYNFLALPFAAGLFFPLWQQQLPPVMGGTAMICSSIFVVCGSAYLRNFKPPVEEAKKPVAGAVTSYGATDSR
eukprot:TRINITY_DN39145_c0_g1_i1.p1 TRINITY_DN39145_c0_g1~~TRINITY_DN39145_c0_g1_i1.p1  ORF type:complete len:813 (+),score=166.64 TRINITY_DN39145_c0_g1_i1:57-2441(+)